jgi:nitrile hydratase accessory protein
MSAAPIPDEPAFAAPWQAQAFAIAALLRDRGVVTWSEWAERLGAALREPPGSGDAGEAYWLAWLAALERLAVDKGAASVTELIERREAWDRAARATPHGRPIVLGAEVSAR